MQPIFCLQLVRAKINFHKIVHLPLWAVAALALTSPLAFAAEPTTFDETLAFAYENNPQLGEQRAAVRAADEAVGRALAGWRPTVAVNGSYGWQQQTQTFLGAQTSSSVPQSEQFSLSQPIFDGRTIPLVKQAKAAVDAARAQLVAAEQSVLLAAATSYFDVVRDTRVVVAYQADIGQLKDIAENANARLRLGELTKTDTSQAVARLMGSKINLAAAELQLASSRAKFEHVVGRLPDDLAPPPLLAIPDSADLALKAAREANPGITQTKAQAREADGAVDAAYGTLLPSLSVQAQYGQSIDQVAPGIRQNGISVIGQLSIPIYQAGQEEATVRQAKEQRTQANLAIAEADRQAEEDVTVSWHAVIASRDSETLAKTQAEANTIAFEGSKVESQVGSRSLIDILNADQELLQSRLSAFAQEDAFLTATCRLRSAIGTLTAGALKLPAKIYDPQQHYDDNAARWFGFGD